MGGLTVFGSIADRAGSDGLVGERATIQRSVLTEQLALCEIIRGGIKKIASWRIV